MEKSFAKLNRFEQLAGDHGVSMTGLALAWLRNHPDVTAPIVGPRRPSHFEPVHEALELDLDGYSYEMLTELFTRS